MAKKKSRHLKGGRTTPKGTRPHNFRPRDDELGLVWDEPDDPDDLDLMVGVRRALADRQPLALLETVSTLAAMLDRKPDPFDRSAPSPSGPTRAELLDTFIDVDRLETTALLAGFAFLGSDEVEKRRLEHVVGGRHHHLPAWLTRLGEARVEGTVELTHVLGDGDNVLVGTRLATGEGIAANIYIDHNLGTIVKDAYVIPAGLDEVRAVMRERIDDPDMSLLDLSPADAKVRAIEAIASTMRTYPPIETDTWPACRPLVEWMVGLLPDGGRGHERREWSPRELADISDRFFASPFGAPLDDEDHRSLLESILWYGHGYGTGDPMRWSPVRVELILIDWIPRKIVADVPYLTKAPAVLRAYMAFCHDEVGIRESLTKDALDAVDYWEPDYQELIRTPRSQGVHALLALGALDPDGPWPPVDEEDLDDFAIMEELLARQVGGVDALDALDDAPLPDEAFDWTAVPDDAHDRVAEVLELADRACDELLDTEYRTACRRVLARIATFGAGVLLRGRAETAAAAVCWGVMNANHNRTLAVGDLLAHFGLNRSVADRARTLLRAGDFPISFHEMTLGSPGYLVAECRVGLIRFRDLWREQG